MREASVSAPIGSVDVRCLYDDGAFNVSSSVVTALRGPWTVSDVNIGAPCHRPNSIFFLLTCLQFR